MRGGVHEPDFLALQDLAVTRPTVIDVGANMGQALLTIKHLLPGARVLCLEPSIAVLPRLMRVANRYEDVEIAAVAAADSYSLTTIAVPVVKGVRFTQYATMAALDEEILASTLKASGFPTVNPRDIKVLTYHCAAAPLDKMVSECDVLKVDAEGFEDRVFAGAMQLVKDSLPILIVERPSDSLQQTLFSLGYERYTGGTVNMVLVHPSRRRGLKSKTETNADD